MLEKKSEGAQKAEKTRVAESSANPPDDKDNDENRRHPKSFLVLSSIALFSIILLAWLNIPDPVSVGVEVKPDTEPETNTDTFITVIKWVVSAILSGAVFVGIVLLLRNRYKTDSPQALSQDHAETTPSSQKPRRSYKRFTFPKFWRTGTVARFILTFAILGLTVLLLYPYLIKITGGDAGQIKDVGAWIEKFHPDNIGTIQAFLILAIASVVLLLVNTHVIADVRRNKGVAVLCLVIIFVSGLLFYGQITHAEAVSTAKAVSLPTKPEPNGWVLLIKPGEIPGLSEKLKLPPFFEMEIRNFHYVRGKEMSYEMWAPGLGTIGKTSWNIQDDPFGTFRRFDKAETGFVTLEPKVPGKLTHFEGHVWGERSEGEKIPVELVRKTRRR